MPIKEPQSVIDPQKEAQEKLKLTEKATIGKGTPKSKKSKLDCGKIDITVQEEEENIVQTPSEEVSCVKLDLKKFTEIGKSRSTSSKNIVNNNWRRLKARVTKNKFQHLNKKSYSHMKDRSMISKVATENLSPRARIHDILCQLGATRPLNTNSNHPIVDLTNHNDNLQPLQLEEVEISDPYIVDELDSETDENQMSNEEYQEFINLINNNIDENTVVADIMNIYYKLEDQDIELAQRILRQFLPEFKIHDVQYFVYRTLFKPAKLGTNLLQIIGGAESAHWICLHYDESNLTLYDSLGRAELVSDEKKYLKKRFPQIEESNILIPRVTRQPDEISCGVYALAFAVEIALGGDPRMIQYSQNVTKMRSHLVQIIRTKRISSFPRLVQIDNIESESR
ncbi:hypothetical protein TKK_0018238 [Trichogramma kaykai]